MYALFNRLQSGDASLFNIDKAVRILVRNFKVSSSVAREILDEHADTVFKKLKPYFRPTEFCHELIDFIRFKFPSSKLVLATNPVWHERITAMRLSWTELDPKLFILMTSAHNMHSTKPHSNYYWEVLNKLEAAPRECLMIGDSESKDLPATSAGIKTFIMRHNASFRVVQPASAQKEVGFLGSLEAFKASYFKSETL